MSKTDPVERYARLVVRSARLPLTCRRLASEWMELAEDGHVERRAASRLVLLLVQVGELIGEQRPPNPPPDCGDESSLRPSERDVLSAVRVLRNRVNGEALLVLPRHVVAEIEFQRGGFVGRSTVNRALKALVKAGLLRRGPRGYSATGGETA
ncbi:MAG TPA: hypothetical protein VGE74_27010 [Gemmata sp.]